MGFARLSSATTCDTVFHLYLLGIIIPALFTTLARKTLCFIWSENIDVQAELIKFTVRQTILALVASHQGKSKNMTIFLKIFH